MTPQFLILRIPAILIVLTIHEYAHGYVALWRGDPTARNAGRLTLNPLAHIDVFGMLMLLFGPFGWARPVPINPLNFREQRKDSVLVAFAGPGINMLAALVCGWLLVLLRRTALPEPAMIFGVLLFEINVGISFFNLLPIPPLDGSKIMLGLLSPAQASRSLPILQRLPMVFFILILAEWALNLPLLSALLNPLYLPYRAIFVLLTGL